MKKIKRDRELLKYAFDFRHPPVLEVEPGEPLTLETEDAPSGAYRSLDDAARLLEVWYLNYSPPMANPVTGPVYIKGFEPGDSLVVHVDLLDLVFPSRNCGSIPVPEADPQFLLGKRVLFPS